MASQVVQLYSNSFSWCVTSSLGTQYDSFSIEPRSFRQTFWLLLTKQCKKKPQYLSYLSDISFVISMGKMTKRQRNNRFLLYLSFILYYPVICRYPDWRVHAYFISWELDKLTALTLSWVLDFQTSGFQKRLYFLEWKCNYSVENNTEYSEVI